MIWAICGWALQTCELPVGEVKCYQNLRPWASAVDASPGTSLSSLDPVCGTLTKLTLKGSCEL